MTGWSKRKRQRAKFVNDIVVLGLCLALPLFLIVSLGDLRTPSLEVVAKLTGGVLSELEPGLTNSALVALQITVFLVALLFGFAYAQGTERRRWERHIAGLGSRLNELRRDADAATRKLGRAEEQQKQVDRELTLELEAIEAKAARRFARHDHNLAKAIAAAKSKQSRKTRPPIGEPIVEPHDGSTRNGRSYAEDPSRADTDQSRSR